MREIAVLILALLALSAATVTPAGADDAILSTTLTGAAERPGPGDTDATGTATVYVDDDTNRVCLSLTYSNVDGTPSGLHIHVAPPTGPGPVVIGFNVPTSSPFFQCRGVTDEALLDNLSVNPQQYYVNLHSTPLYPGGAIRGQLAHNS